MKIIGKGSVTKLEKKEKSKCRKWRLRVNTSEGERSKRFDGTYTKALDELKVFVASLSTPVSELKFKDYAETWVSRRERSGDVTASTVYKNRQQVKALDRAFGEMLLHEITTPVAKDGLLEVKGGGKRVLSGTYMHQLHAVMKAVMESAVDDGYIERNPLAKVKAPKMDVRKRRSLSREKLACFLLALEELPLDSYTVAVRLAVLAGLRRGEIMALRWRSVGDGLIKVRQALNEHTRKLGKTKTPDSVRDVPVPEQLGKTLEAWRAIQEEKFAYLGKNFDGDTFVVSSQTGGNIHPQNLDRWWRNNRAAFGLEGYVLHELRHTYLTMLASSGASSNVLKNLAGWSSIAMADTYVHDDPRANEEAAGALGKMIGFEIVRAKNVPIDVPADVPPHDSGIENIG